jgi:predicted nucleotidyltransferase
MMRPHPEPRVASFLDEIAHQGIGLATITVWEILNGIGLLGAARGEMNRHSDVDLLIIKDGADALEFMGEI